MLHQGRENITHNVTRKIRALFAKKYLPARYRYNPLKLLGYKTAIDYFGQYAVLGDADKITAHLRGGQGL